MYWTKLKSAVKEKCFVQMCGTFVRFKNKETTFMIEPFNQYPSAISFGNHDNIKTETQLTELYSIVFPCVSIT